jgi:hypothetical protein
MTNKTGHEMAQELGTGQRVAEGWEVYTCDGERLGTVKEVREAYFKVNASMRPDYWLQTQLVETCMDGRATMEFAKDMLGDYKVSEVPDRLTDGRVIDTAPPSPAGGLPENSAASTLSAAERRDV